MLTTAGDPGDRSWADGGCRGDRGAGADIPGGATLIFDLELLETFDAATGFFMGIHPRLGFLDEEFIPPIKMWMLGVLAIIYFFVRLGFLGGGGGGGKTVSASHILVKTEEEAAAAAKRREELEAIRKQREQLAAEEPEELVEEPVEEAEEAQAGQQPSAAPGAGQPADDKREARRDQADRDASGVLV